VEESDVKTSGIGTIGDRIVLENEHVRVWLVELDPGQIQSRHIHELPYLIVPLTDGKNIMRFDDGREIATDEKPGICLWRMPGVPHELENVSSWQYRNVLVEMKAPAAATPPTP
jgi:quercetin dioxygenase-like cupin family protein